MSKKVKVKTIPVVAVHEHSGRVRMFKSQLECSRVLGLHIGNINECLEGRRESEGGYVIKKINRLIGGIV